MTNGEVLNSWKEIATYLGRGVRTVQRWERDLDLPVRRPRGKHRSAVIAIKEDLDLWLRTPHYEAGVEGDVRKIHIKAEVHARLLRNTETLLARTAILLENSNRLKKQVGRAILIATLRKQTQEMKAGVSRALDIAAALQGGGGDDSTVKTIILGVPENPAQG